VGPLQGLKVIELAGIGPGPMAAMLLADLGATVLRVDRKEPAALGVPRPPEYDLLLRNRRSLPLNLKDASAVALVLDLVERSDVLIEGFRPGVTERLGLGPEVCLARNPRLVYGRITGWGQEGPMAQDVGHDLNYIALAGALHAIGRAGQPPTPPINLLGDFAGGTLYMIIGILAALHESKSSGKGQIVDAAMVDGVANLMTQPYGSFAGGLMSNERGTNATDSGAPFYDVYQCSDQRWVSLAAVEKKFYAAALRVLGLPESLLQEQWNRERWPAAKARVAAVFRTRTRDAWCESFAGVEACFAPVLALDEAPHHPHFVARGTFSEIGGVIQPMPAPRFSRSIPDKPEAFRPWDADEAHQILRPWLDNTAVDAARTAGIID
jgi:alpha-methylacyl-CoA racemase